jgi:hypothetical protein
MARDNPRIEEKGWTLEIKREQLNRTVKEDDHLGWLMKNFDPWI